MSERRRERQRLRDGSEEQRVERTTLPTPAGTLRSPATTASTCRRPRWRPPGGSHLAPRWFRVVAGLPPPLAPFLWRRFLQKVVEVALGNPPSGSHLFPRAEEPVLPVQPDLPVVIPAPLRYMPGIMHEPPPPKQGVFACLWDVDTCWLHAAGMLAPAAAADWVRGPQPSLLHLAMTRPHQTWSEMEPIVLPNCPAPSAQETPSERNQPHI